MNRSFFITLCLSLVIAVQLPALDFGGTLRNYTGFMTGQSDGALIQKDRFSGYFNHEINEKMKIDAGLYFTVGTVPENGIQEFYFDFEISELSLSGLLELPSGSVLKYEAGRMNANDFTYQVFDHLADGFEVSYLTSFADFRFFAGYTGLVSKKASGIVMSLSDLNRSGYLGSSRIVDLVDARFPQLFADQDLIVSLVNQIDLNLRSEQINTGDLYSASLGGPLHTVYGGAGLRGPIPITEGLFHNSFLYFGTGVTRSYILDGNSDNFNEYLDVPIISAMAGSTIDYYRRDWLYSHFSLNLLYASGDGDSLKFFEGNSSEIATDFHPISQSGTNFVFNPPLKNLFSLNFRYSLQPFAGSELTKLKSLQVSSASSVFFRTSLGPINDSDADPNSDRVYMGTEFDLMFSARPFSDLAIELGTGLFIPNPELFTTSDVRFKGSLSFRFIF